ncbi:hypothetical protein Mgra_00008494 [Meloidogyne graminicola]|uniref:Saposin B-type domain-containing protein n=1 Tax=Meloidogyne graminicola TaxID=189291 RepID=A0A8S9ZFP5_9BILA|nr:hypothetical protein Mgra_00008494 [Meloidogyne graminicola]
MNFILFFVFVIFYSINGHSSTKNQKVLDYNQKIIEEITYIHNKSYEMMESLFLFSLRSQRNKSNYYNKFNQLSISNTNKNDKMLIEYREDIDENIENKYEICQDCQLIANATETALEMLSSETKLYKLFCRRYNKNIHLFQVLSNSEVLCTYVTSSCQIDSRRYDSLLAGNRIPCELCKYVLSTGLKISKAWAETISVFEEICPRGGTCFFQIKSLEAALQTLSVILESWLGVIDGCKTIFFCV